MSASRILKFAAYCRSRNPRFFHSRNCQVLSSARYAQTVLNLPETNISELKNGFKVATQTTDSPIATVGVWIEAGSRFETEENNGCANFLEHIIFKGTQNKSHLNLMTEINSIGAQFDSYTDREETAFYAKCLSSDAPKVVEILADSISNPKIDDEIVEEERKIILQELKEVESDLRQVTFDYMHLTGYQGTPLEKSYFGSSKNIQRLSKDDILFYARNNFMAPRMVLCASGNVNHDELVKIAEKGFSSLPVTYTSEIPTFKPCRFTGSDVRHREDWLPFANVAVAVNTCGFGNPDLYPLMLAKAYLGKWDKTYARSADTSINLIQNIYKEKRCHGYESFHTVYRDTGLFGCYFIMDKMILDDFMFNLQNEWMKLCINVTEPELIIARNMLQGSRLLDLDDPLRVCADMGKQVLLTGKHVSFEEAEDKLEAVTLQQFRDTCMKYIYDRCPVVAAIGPVEGLTDYARIRGNMYWLRY